MEQGRPTPPDLGERIAVFRPSLANTIAGFILGLLGVVVGLALVVWAARGLPPLGDNPWTDGPPSRGVKLGVGVTGLLIAGLLGVGFLWLARDLLGYHVDLHAGGFRCRFGQGVRAVRWSDIQQITETVVYERPPILTGPASLLLPKLADRTYWVTTRAGERFGFGRDQVKKFGKFGRLLKAAAEQHGLAWQTVEQHA